MVIKDVAGETGIVVQVGLRRVAALYVAKDDTGKNDAQGRRDVGFYVGKGRPGAPNVPHTRHDGAAGEALIIPVSSVCEIVHDLIVEGHKLVAVISSSKLNGCARVPIHLASEVVRDQRTPFNGLSNLRNILLQ